MCEVAVCEGDVGGHARACSRISRGECEYNGVQSGRRDTQVCVGRMAMETVTVDTCFVMLQKAVYNQCFFISSM